MIFVAFKVLFTKNNDSTNMLTPFIKDNGLDCY